MTRPSVLRLSPWRWRNPRQPVRWQLEVADVFVKQSPNQLLQRREQVRFSCEQVFISYHPQHHFAEGVGGGSLFTRLVAVHLLGPKPAQLSYFVGTATALLQEVGEDALELRILSHRSDLSRNRLPHACGKSSEIDHTSIKTTSPCPATPVVETDCSKKLFRKEGMRRIFVGSAGA